MKTGCAPRVQRASLPPAMNRKIEFASHPANLCMVRNLVREFVEGLGLTVKEVDLIVLGVDEACTNIIRHVYNHESSHLIALCCERGEESVRFRLRDYGAHPSEPHLLQGRELDAVRPGGLGLHLIRSAFDHVDFQKQSVGTELVLTKRLQPAAATGA